MDYRTLFARKMAASSGSADPRFEEIFKTVPREAFMGEGPWKIMVVPDDKDKLQRMRYVETADSDPEHIYQDNLVALDAAKGINNGVPSLHARWIGMVAPKSGESVIHIGAGTGYYSAILSRFVLPGGQVTAFEIDERLAKTAKENLHSYDNVTLRAANAVTTQLPLSDIIYVNAGVAELPEHWLLSLKPKGRIVFPWCPAPGIGLAMSIIRVGRQFAAMVMMPAWFIPCIGASNTSKAKLVSDEGNLWKIQSVLLTRDREPDKTALVVYKDIWFSSAPASS